MKICLIAKYPPIEGGESAKCYWLAKALGKLGHEVHIVTNAYEVEDAYREKLEGEDLNNAYQPEGVQVHSTDPFFNPSYIPYSKPYTEKLASLAIDVINKYNLQIIDSWYVLPYVISGFIAKTVTGKPQIMRHAGSDIGKLFFSPYLHTIFKEVFKRVDKIVTYPSMKKRFVSLGINEEKLFYNTVVSVDPSAFNPSVSPIDLSKYVEKKASCDCPVISYIGKLGVTKGIYELAEAASLIKENFLLLFVTGGENLGKFKDYIKEIGLQEKTEFIEFLPPWKIPRLIKASTCVVCPEREFPVKEHTPILPREVMAVGNCLVLSKELYTKYRKKVSSHIKDKENVLVIEPKEIEKFKNVLETIIKNPTYAEKIGHQAYLTSRKIEKFEKYVDNTIKLYQQVLGQKEQTHQTKRGSV